VVRDEKRNKQRKARSVSPEPASKRAKGSKEKEEGKERATLKKAAGPVEKPKTCVVKEMKNFAPEGETLHSGKNNTIHSEAYIGHNWFLKCHTWKKENRVFFQIRKNSNIGANIPAEYFSPLIAALTVMKEECADILPDPVPVSTHKSD
jgi:acetyltransferase-like isoleucine patch superfamily enzyme